MQLQQVSSCCWPSGCVSWALPCAEGEDGAAAPSLQGYPGHAAPLLPSVRQAALWGVRNTAAIHSACVPLPWVLKTGKTPDNSTVSSQLAVLQALSQCELAGLGHTRPRVWRWKRPRAVQGCWNLVGVNGICVSGKRGRYFFMDTVCYCFPNLVFGCLTTWFWIRKVMDGRGINQCQISRAAGKT